MEALAGSFLSASVNAVIERLMSINWLKYVGQGQVLDQLKRWETILRRINAALDDAEEMHSTTQLDQIWLTDLKHLAYDVEDVVDQLATEVQLHYPEDQDDVNVRPSNMRKLLCSCCVAVKPTTVLFNKEMLSKVGEISARLDRIIREKDDLKLGDSKRKKTVIQGRERLPATCLVNEAKVYGRDNDRRAVLDLLANADADVAVIPIIGMGGIGKTTLAQLIYNDTSLEFDFRAWVSVGEDFDVSRITRTILQHGGDKEDLNSLQVKLKQKLSGIRFLIILDDVWSEKYDDWTHFMGPFEAGAPKSRIIITTRSHEVSRIAGGTGTAHHLEGLSYEECLSVFCQHALGATNFEQHSTVKAMGEEIVTRCKGLPLAAKTLGGALKGKPDITAWEKVAKSEIWDLSEGKSNILPALRLSYLYLPPHLKRCFAYCSFFPKDYEFDKNELILLWMAEGFLGQPSKKKHREDIGHEYFDELLSRSFFQQSNANKSRYVMHDLINDLARFVSPDTYFHLGDNNELVGGESHEYIRHSSFMARRYNLYGRFECFHRMVKLRTFLSREQYSYPTKYINGMVLRDLLQKLKCLRVLSLTNFHIEELPSTVGELKLLRYLDLSRTHITRLPESMGNLINLETLKLCHCYYLTELPKSICNLINLSYLDIDGTNQLKEMPAQIGNLTSLHMLSKFIVGEGNDGLKISELKKLPQLSRKLEVQGIHNARDVSHGNFFYLKEKPGLLELWLEWGDSTHHNEIQDEQILKSLEPNKHVISLKIGNFSGGKFASWLADPIFPKMVKLQLVHCENVKSLPALGRLPSLKELVIKGLSGVEELGSEFYEDDSSFPCLESLEIEGMSQWKQWSWPSDMNGDSAGKFLKLSELRINNCPKLEGKFPSLLPSLGELAISGCKQLTDLPRELPSLKSLYISGCDGAVLKSLGNAPSLTELKVEGMKGLSTFEESYKQAMTALQKFEIVGCRELKYLWADGSNVGCLTSLKHLKISRCGELVSLVNGEEGLFPFNLEYLSLSHCNKLKEKEFLNGLSSLKTLDINECPLLEVHCNSQLTTCLQTLRGNSQFLELIYYGLSHLRELHFSHRDEVESFPERELPIIPTLTELVIVSCKRLKSLTNHMASFPLLQSLRISLCGELESFPDNGLPNISLVSFFLRDCPRLKSLPNQMQNLTSLQTLYLRQTGISSLERCLPPNLTQLYISQCENLNQPLADWGLHTLTSLKSLTLPPKRDMVSFPDSDGLLLPTSLTYLHISKFEKTESISRGLQNLTCLQQLEVSNCPKLKTIPVESLPPSLEYIEISQCPGMEEWYSNGKGQYDLIIRYV